MEPIIEDRIEVLKRCTNVNAAHLNEALKIIGEQKAEIDRLTRVAVEWERDMNGTLATLESERRRNTELLKSLESIARLSMDGEDGFDLTNDDAVDSLHSCIDLARDVLGRVA